jgi:hypothetical protein
MGNPPTTSHVFLFEALCLPAVRPVRWLLSALSAYNPLAANRIYIDALSRQSVTCKTLLRYTLVAPPVNDFVVENCGRIRGSGHYL